MKSTFESSCMFVLASCLVSWLGLFILSGQCSMPGIAITMAGLAGIAWGIPSVIASSVSRLATRFGKAEGVVPIPI